MNPLLIPVSLSFWGWVWGTPGALLAVPLLIILQTVIAAAGKPDIAGFLFEHGTLMPSRREESADTLRQRAQDGSRGRRALLTATTPPNAGVADPTTVVWGKRVPVRVANGGRRRRKKKN